MASAPRLESAPAPLRVVVTRDVEESEHLVDVVVVAPEDTFAIGVPDKPVIPRSSIKPIQVLPLIESGAATTFEVTDAEIALGAASHSGEPAHVAAVDAWLARIGLDRGALECGADRPISQSAADELLRSGVAFEPIHNCCSGKHAAFLSVAVHLGIETGGYIKRDHPVQQLVTDAIERYTGVDLTDASNGIDGCGIPTFALPLTSLASSMRRLVTSQEAAPGRVSKALPGNAFWISGTDRLEARLEALSSTPLVLKTGAEGVYMGAVPAHGIGIALKARDGAQRASEAALMFVLGALGIADPNLSATPITNKAGTVVGTTEVHFQ